MTEPPDYLKQLLAKRKGKLSKPLWLPHEKPSRDFILAVLEQARIEVNNAARKGKIKRCDYLVNLSWVIADQEKDAEFVACAEWCEGLSLLNKSQEKAANHFERAAAFYKQNGKMEESARVGVNLISLYGQLGRYKESEELAREVISVLKNKPDYRNWPSVYLNASISARYVEKFDDMLNFANLAEQEAKRLSRNSDLAQARVNQALALCHMGKLDESLMILDNVFPEHDDLYTNAQVHLIRSRALQYKNHLFESIREAYLARQLFEKAGQRINVATTVNEEALLYTRLSMWRDALRCYEIAAKEFAEGKLPAERAEVLLNIARIALLNLRQPNRSKKALIQLREITPQPQSMTLLRKVYENHPLLIKDKSQRKQKLQCVDSLSKKLKKIGDKASFIDAEYIALLLADRREAERRGKSVIHDARIARYRAMECAAYVDLAKTQKPNVAREYLRQAVSLLEQERREISNEELKANALTGHSAIYSLLVKTELDLRLPKDAANTLLKAKGGGWADMAQPDMTSTRADEDIDPEWVKLREQEKFWTDEAREGGLEQTVEYARHQLESTKIRLIEHARQRAIKTKGVDVPSLGAVQQELDKNTVVADMMLAGQKAFVCMYHAQNAVPEWLDLGDLTDVANSLSAFRASLRPLQMAMPKERTRLAEVTLPAVNELIGRMRQAVVEPLLGWMERNAKGFGQITVSPDGWLYELPWSALFAETKWHEAGGVFGLTLSPALLALPKPRSAMGRSLVLGYSGDPPLEHVGEEVKTVATHLTNALVFYPARRSNLSWEEPPEVLHVATHGALYQTTPLLSRLQFADGGLLLADVLRLNLRGTQLVTLSACETGALPEQGGAAMALAGAFLSAGAQAVLASQWQVDDERTQVWMDAFYENFNCRDGKDRAVKYANQKSREKTHLHPFFWAGIQAIS